MTNIVLGNISSFVNDSTAVTQYNANNALITTAFSDALSKSGETPNTMSAVLDMNNFNIVNLPSPATINSPVRLVDVINPSVALTVPPVGTSGSTVPLLNGVNTWSAQQTFNSSAPIVSAGTNSWSGTNTFTGTFTANVINTGTGAVNRTINHKMNNVIYAEDYGAVFDGVTNDVAAINNAITAASAASGSNSSAIVQLPPGTAIVGVSTINMASNVSLRGAGKGVTFLKIGSAYSGFIISGSGVNNVSCSDFTIDAGSFATGVNSGGINFFNCIDVNIDRVGVINMGSFGLAFVGVTRGRMADCYIKLNSATGSVQNEAILISSFQTNTNIVVTRNVLINSGMEIGAVYSSVTDNFISGWKFGSGVTTEVATNSNNLVISGNVIGNSSGIDSNGFYPSGIEQWSANSVVVGNIIYSCSGAGIIGGGLNGVISGNTCYNNGVSQPGGAFGILMQYSSALYNGSNSCVTGNVCYDTRGISGTQTYGIGDNLNCSGIYYANNMLNTNVTGTYLLQSINPHLDDITSPPRTITSSTYSQLFTDDTLIFNASGTSTVTLISAAAYVGKKIVIKTIAAHAVTSASSNVCPLGSATPGTGILSGSAGQWVILQSDGTNWIAISGLTGV